MILEADSIQLSFGNKVILSDIYLKCEKGKITGLLGRNGQGKSCLMNIMYGTMLSEKSVRINGISVPHAFKNPRQLLYLPQFNFIPSGFSIKRVLQDFSIPLHNFLNDAPQFDGRLKNNIRALSGGEKRFIELYCIICTQTNFVLLDEPFTHLNPLQIEKAKELMNREKQNKGILVSDHMFRHVLDIKDQLYILANGKTHLSVNDCDIEKLGYARL